MLQGLDLFAGVNVAMVAGIIGVLLGIRASDSKAQKLGKGFYIVLAMILGFVGAALVVKPFTIKNWIPSGIAHAGAASILYQFGKLVLPGNDYTFLKKPVDAAPPAANDAAPDAKTPGVDAP